MTKVIFDFILSLIALFLLSFLLYEPSKAATVPTVKYQTSNGTYGDQATACATYKDNGASFTPDGSSDTEFFCYAPNLKQRFSGGNVMYGCSIGQIDLKSKMCIDPAPGTSWPVDKTCLAKADKGPQNPGAKSPLNIESKTKMDVYKILKSPGCDVSGCKFDTFSVSEGKFEDGSGYTYRIDSYMYTSDACNPNSNTYGSNNQNQIDFDKDGTGKNENSCPDGQAMGEFNGQKICLPVTDTKKHESNQTTDTVTNPDGSQSKTTTDKKYTSNNDGTVTTDTTVTNPDGSQKKSSRTEPIADFCQAHSNSSICKDEQKKSANFSSCKAPPQCDGDAIMCAIAKLQYEQKCAHEKELEDLQNKSYTTKGDQLLNGNDPDAANLPDPSKPTTVVVQGSLDQSSFLPSQCFSDKSFTFKNQTYTLKFSLICDYANIFRAVIMFIASIVALRVIFGGGGSKSVTE